MDLSVAMIRIRYELKQKINEIRQSVNVPPYIINAVLSDIQNDLAAEEKELLTIMLTKAEEGVEDNGQDDVLHDSRESD